MHLDEVLIIKKKCLNQAFNWCQLYVFKSAPMRMVGIAHWQQRAQLCKLIFELTTKLMCQPSFLLKLLCPILEFLSFTIEHCKVSFLFLKSYFHRNSFDEYCSSQIGSITRRLIIKIFNHLCLVVKVKYFTIQHFIFLQFHVQGTMINVISDIRIVIMNIQ